jgi:KipI family sensor histidine kinase inhibitor
MAEGLYPAARYRAVGDTGLLVAFGDRIDPEINRRVRAMTVALRAASLAGLVEVIPTYCCLMVCYDPQSTSPGRLEAALTEQEARLDRIDIPPPRTVEIPVCYGGKYGPDIEFVARHNQLSTQEVIRLHCGPEYLIYMVGFTPGYPYLGGLSPRLHTPRLETPRTRVPAGSVGIGGAQTGVYPVDSPGGWRLIGRTPLVLFDPVRSQPFCYQMGDRIRFRPISAAQFDRGLKGRRR